MNDLFSAVLHQIVSDVEHGDLEALDEFLKQVYNPGNHQAFVDYLPENNLDRYDKKSE